jgi:GTP-binding protein HflX
MAQNISTLAKQETAVLVALITPQQPKNQTKEYLAELALLTQTLGIQILTTFTQTIQDQPHAKTLVGQGKLAVIRDFVKENQVDKVIFDDELSPSQLRNLETILACQVLDRTLVILNIFAMRAKKRQAKTQVALAQYQYLLPRLTKMWSHLSRQKGGNTGMRGPGEKELETDRRIVQAKINLLKQKLKAIDRQGVTQRKARGKWVRIALVGYTNVGKSTLMQLLSKTEVGIEDKLFATIDSTVRRIRLHDITCLLTDTVGFIRKLPHTLIESFKSTLDEIREADILLHVVDLSHPGHEQHIQTVQETLQAIGATHIPTILVFNKLDQWMQDYPDINVEALKNRYQLQYEQTPIFIAAKEKYNIDLLKEALYEHVKPKNLLIYPNYFKQEGY